MPDIMIEATYKAIGERIAARRHEWMVSQAALATMMHLPIGRIELGLEKVSITGLFTIAHALRCPVAWLLPESEQS